MIRFFRKFFYSDWGQSEPMLSNRNPVLQFNKRPVLHQEISARATQAALDELQQHLCDRGYLSTLSGKFDAETDQAVRAFQSDHNLLVDGVVGLLTYQWLETGYLRVQSNGQVALSDSLPCARQAPSICSVCPA